MPNLLVFLTDDHGQWASRCYGTPALHTPSLDWLATTGARFPNAYTPCPVCSPARASFWTGKIPSAHGIHDFLFHREHPGITGQSHLGDQLQAAGYRTALCGKWHCHAKGETPQPGFDFWFSQWEGTNARFGNQPFSDQGERRDFHGHQAPIITDTAIRFLREHQAQEESQPFFLFVGYTETHSPFKSLPERLVAPHRLQDPLPIEREAFADAHGIPGTPAPEDETAFREQLAQYFASVEMIDEQVGRILDELEGQGLLDDTLIVYTSDHGHMNGQHGLLNKGNATTPQNFPEESIRVPLLIRPAGGAPTQTPELRVDHCDLHATLREAAGLALEPQPGSPGRSFLATLQGETPLDWRGDQFGDYGNARMIRSAEGFKLIRRYPGPNGQFPDEFYDLTVDPRETRNLIADPTYEEQMQALDDRLHEWFMAHEVEGCEGTGVGEREPFNTNEPWRRELPG